MRAEPDSPHRYSTQAMQEGDETAAPTSSYIVFAKRWWWLLLIGAILGVGGGYGYVRYGPIGYTTSALVQVPAASVMNPSGTAAQARSDTTNYAAEASSSQIVSLVGQALASKGGPNTATLLQMSRKGDIVVAPENGSNFIAIKVIDTVPARAKLIADTYATVFVNVIDSETATQIKAEQQQLLSEISFARQHLDAAGLFQQQQSLESQIRDQQTTLLNLQSSYQTDLENQSQLAAVKGAVTQSPELQGIRANLQRIFTNQINGVEGNIASLNKQLAQVNEQLSKLPPGTDPALSTAYASAYTATLGDLTKEYVSQQVATLTASPPVIQSGVAPPAYRAKGIKKYLGIGLLVGLILTAGIGWLIDRRRRGKQRLAPEAAGTTNEQSDVDVLLRTLQDARSAYVPAANGVYANDHGRFSGQEPDGE